MADRVDYQGKGLGLVDDKGRVAIPNTLRASLAKNAPRDDGKDGGTVIIAPHPKHRCLIAYDPGFVPHWKAKLEAMNAAHTAAGGAHDYNILDRAGGAEPLPFDGSGRFIMPTFERRYAKIGGAAVFLGSFDWITIWSPAILLETPEIDPFLKEYVEFACEDKGIAL
ncbi:MAG: division/cell wall cluster transcriptional repressor MraZ [Sphingomonas adhaesiva]|uniref:division/cell wall cluster transcriptional repressor MraZ n=1 Tax=Sphingomonas adhaesiva TaxID=28212 RepID=UPI002FF52998